MKKLLSKIALPVIALGFLTACEDVPAPYYILEKEANNPEVTGVYFSETFANSLGKFSVYNETSDGYEWRNDYSSAYISGYQNQTNLATTTWLISPVIDLSKATDSVYVSFEYVLRYKRTTTKEQVRISTNYTDGAPSTATWTTLDLKLKETPDYNTWNTAAVNIPKELLGSSNVVVALYYSSGATEASTWEVRNFAIKKGAAEGGGVTPPSEGSIFESTFLGTDGGFTIKDVNKPEALNFVWTNTDNYGWKASAYYNNTNYATESWIVSPAIKLPADEDANVSFEHVYRYTNNKETHLTLQVSEDQNNWTKLTIPTYSTGSDWTFVNSGDISLKAYKGKTIYLAFKYVSTSSEGATWEIKNFAVYTGERGGGETPIDDGSNSKTNPYNVQQALSKSGNAWVKGYIVGYVDGISIGYASFGIPTEAQTEVLIADDANETDYTKCMPVQLPAGEIRNAVDLFTNPGNLKKEATLYGSIEKYFGTQGLKSTSCAIIDGKMYGTEPGNEPVSDNIFESPFTGGVDGGFTINNVTMPSDLSYIWMNDATYGWKASAYYNGTRYVTESWLISPAIALPNEDCHLAFEHVYRYTATANKQLTLHISTDKSNWTNMTIPNYPDGNSWTFISSGNIDLAKYKGKTVYFAFKYTSSESEAATWEIKNFVVAKGAGDAGTGGGDDPGDTPGGDDNPPASGGTYDAPYSVAEAQGVYNSTGGTATKAYVTGYIVGWVDGNSYAAGAQFNVPSEAQTEILIAASASETNPDNCIPIQLPKGEMRDALELNAHPALLGQKLLVYGSIEKYFSVAGIKSPSYAEVNGTTVGTKAVKRRR